MTTHCDRDCGPDCPDGCIRVVSGDPMAAVTRAVQYSLIKVTAVVLLAAAIGSSAGGWLLSYAMWTEGSVPMFIVREEIQRAVRVSVRAANELVLVSAHQDAIDVQQRALDARLDALEASRQVAGSGFDAVASDSGMLFVDSTNTDFRVESDTRVDVAMIDGETGKITYAPGATCEDALRAVAKGVR